ncbi:hypothetical protein LCM20_15905 [Halobacillus litoralis]|uniref:hypothetical protein n=1 Tax=Halobacillus litoralis TaxID=45668 RepID=UPI001CD25C2E|nr:hypothetical protein [Halobacillus litoralis]MCA0972092.1 hypothetical protein [Halobacillus litoralis]
MPNCLYVLKPFRYEKGNKGCSCHEIVRFQKGDHLHIIGEPFFVDHIGWYACVQQNEEDPYPMSAEFIDELYHKGALRTSMDLDLSINYHQHKIDEALANREEAVFLSHTQQLNTIQTIISGMTMVKEG